MPEGSRRESTKPTHVAALIFMDDLLLIQRRSSARGFLPDAWDVIGGAIDPGESPEEALDREVFEETGLSTNGRARWLDRHHFVQRGRQCIEVSALVEIKPDALRLETDKASSFALTTDLTSFVADNIARGYGDHLGRIAATVLDARRSGEAW